MTTVNWAQLTPGQQACLDTLARAGREWRRSPSILDASTLKDYIGLRDDLHLIETKLSEYTDFVLYDRVTAKGLLVWQQGQVASVPPRSVWVAMWHEYGEGDYLLSIHAQHETAQTACEVHAEQALKWEYAAGFDGMGEYRARVYDDDVLQGEYFVHEMPVLP